jgi:hypothetical protein
MTAVLRDEQIGGGVVLRRFTIVDRHIMVGTRLSRNEILAIKNRRTLIGSDAISVHPRAVACETEPGERHIVHNGGGRYDVIEGRKLNSGPLTKDEAEDLATRPN